MLCFILYSTTARNIRRYFPEPFQDVIAISPPLNAHIFFPQLTLSHGFNGGLDAREVIAQEVLMISCIKRRGRQGNVGTASVRKSCGRFTDINISTVFTLYSGHRNVCIEITQSAGKTPFWYDIIT